jgi:2-polyprenyl-3-methyl-5-hydroxy-6-metoxy-1,4-benzoquinol methylase
MSFDFHHNKNEYFRQQYENSKNYVLPFIQLDFPEIQNKNVLEIGCAEGGVLKAFTDLGCVCTGVELSTSKVENAKKFMENEWKNGQIQFICKNIYDLDFQNEFQHFFDVILLKDTIEHIPQQENIIAYLKSFLKPNGVIFFGFPPWYMPWGGHQQICKSKVLMLMPYFHLLPMPVYQWTLKFWGETDIKIKELVEIKETGISTHRFEHILKQSDYKILRRRFYFVNPIYRYKFQTKPLEQWKWLGKIPFLRDIFATTVYYNVQAIR